VFQNCVGGDEEVPGWKGETWLSRVGTSGTRAYWKEGGFKRGQSLTKERESGKREGFFSFKQS